MPITPMTRYYVRRLIQDQAVALGLIAEPLSGTDSQNSQFVEELVDFAALSENKAAELDLLVRLHQSFSQLGPGYRGHVEQLESKLWSLLGLVDPVTNSLPSPPTVVALIDQYTAANVTLSQAVASLNQVGQVAKKYLGDLITRNYWQSSRPHSSWFVDYELASHAEIQYRGADDYFLTSEQLTQLQAWLDTFIHQCQRVLPQFPQMLTNANVALTVPGLSSLKS
ncbi:hypothetical protein RIF25_04375 [Thermosynechococcaceae cyanobacterium BACA0444]|uniref:Uncharacterized protein n=1 Tax=Pseudocalidococcus azoricus BACA0444 TaxID=2918990 RepID=A0AAE4JXK6_9CYAN|nr:hypothetical protein [Pseudocalidococcus azoricus]MDS3860039.1 hypothetical protein [Pseudocalidococcus azoricus BACA0444]